MIVAKLKIFPKDFELLFDSDKPLSVLRNAWQCALKQEKHHRQTGNTLEA